MIHGKVKDHLPHWRTDIGTVVFHDQAETTKQEFVVSLKRSAVVLEDIGTVQEFVDRAKTYLTLMYNALDGAIHKLDRVGVRFVEVCEPTTFMPFDKLNTQFVSKFMQLPEELVVSPVDSLVRLVHKNGLIHMGPVREGEKWLQDMFSDPAANVPKVGLGLDIDSYSTDLKASSAEDVVKAFQAVYEVTKSVEESVLRHMGFIDE
jgi:hypothetical protein